MKARKDLGQEYLVLQDLKWLEKIAKDKAQIQAIRSKMGAIE